MRKSKLFVTTALAVFLLANFAVATASAAKPTPLPSLVFNGPISFPDSYFPGVPTPLGQSGLIQFKGRMTAFTVVHPMLGPLTFVATEDSVVNEMGVGTTHGRITITSPVLGTLMAESNGKVFPILVGGQLAIGFKGHLATIGKGNQVVHITGAYEGHFLPDAEMMSGLFHIEAELKMN